MRTILLPEWLIDGTGAPAQTGRAVVINGRLIEAIVPAAAVTAAPGDQTRPLPGMTLIPGLINNHVHSILPGDNTPFFDMNPLSDATLALRAAHNTRTALRAGVTTMRDCGARGTLALDVRDAQARGHVTGARIIACGWPITITGGHTRNFGGEADNPDGLRVMVRRKVSLGADFVKVMASGGGTPGSLANYPSYTTDELRVIVETAHGLGKRVVAHCICVQAIENAVDAGVDFIEHAMFTTPDRGTVFDERVANKLARSGIVVTPTMQVFRDLRDMLPPGAERDGWTARNNDQRQVVSRLRELGVPLLAGSDAGWRATAFDTFWKELDELGISGMSPVDAVSAASGAIVRVWGISQYGIVEAGRIADLVVVEGNVAADIKCLQGVKHVFQAGVSVN